MAFIANNKLQEGILIHNNTIIDPHDITNFVGRQFFMKSHGLLWATPPKRPAEVAVAQWTSATDWHQPTPAAFRFRSCRGHPKLDDGTNNIKQLPSSKSRLIDPENQPFAGNLSFNPLTGPNYIYNYVAGSMLVYWRDLRRNFGENTVELRIPEIGMIELSNLWNMHVAK